MPLFLHTVDLVGISKLIKGLVCFVDPNSDMEGFLVEDLLAIFFQNDDFFAIEQCSKEFLRFIIEEYIVLNHPGDCKASKEELSKYFSEITRKELDSLEKKFNELVIWNRTKFYLTVAVVAVVALFALGLATGEISPPGGDSLEKLQ